MTVEFGTLPINNVLSNVVGRQMNHCRERNIITIRLARKKRYCSVIRNAHTALLQRNNTTRFSFKRIIATEKKNGASKIRVSLGTLKLPT